MDNSDEITSTGSPMAENSEINVVIREGCPVVEAVISCPEATDEIKAIAETLRNWRRKIPCTKDGATYFIDKRAALYAESVDKRCYLYTEDEVYETQLRLYELEALLAADGFIRTSKSQILNILKIGSLCPEFGGRIEAILENGEKILISRQYAKILKNKLGVK